MAIENLAWGVVALPLLGALASLLAETARRAAQTCVAFCAGAAVLAAITLGVRLTHSPQAPFENVITFFAMSPPEGTVFTTRFEPFIGIHVDGLSAAFGAAVAFVVVCIQSYALTTLRGDPGYRRFAWTSSLLAFATLGFVFSTNLFESLFMWLAGGVSLYLMGSHWWQRADAAAPARRAFVVLQASGLALLLGAVVEFIKFGVFAATIPAPAGQDTTDVFSFTTISQAVSAVPHGQVGGAGPRTLAILASLLVFAAVLRALQLPWQVWLTELTTAPVPAIAAASAGGGLLGVYLLARTYPVLVSRPAALTALALMAGVSAVVAGLAALAQRDVLRIGAFAAALQLSLALVALGAGGYSQAMFILFTSVFLTALGALAAGSLVRVYRSRDLDDMGGAWRRMPATTVGLVVWAAGIGGAALQGYYALAAVLLDQGPGGAPLAAPARLAAAVMVGAACLLAALLAVRTVVLACSGEVVRRRGFQPERVVEVERPLRRWTLILTLASCAAVLVGLPGIQPVHSGRLSIPGLTFTHFVFFGARRPALPVDGVALVVVALGLLLGTAMAIALWAPARRQRARERVLERLAPAASGLRRGLYAEWLAAHAGVAVQGLARAVAGADERVLGSLPDAATDTQALLAWGLLRLRRRSRVASLAAALTLAALLTFLSVLAATGHLGVHLA